MPPPDDPVILQSVSGDISYEHSSSSTLAARPEISTVVPSRFGTVNEIGDALLVAPNCQVESATTKVLVASGASAQFEVVVMVVPVFDAMVCSCAAPVPLAIRTVAPMYSFASMLSVLLPIVVTEKMSALS